MRLWRRNGWDDTVFGEGNQALPYLARTIPYHFNCSRPNFVAFIYQSYHQQHVCMASEEDCRAVKVTACEVHGFGSPLFYERNFAVN